MDEQGEALLSSVMLPSIKNRQKKLCQIQNNGAGALYKREENNIGARLMAKCGWSVGKGLGKAEDGITVPIQLRYKNDNEGMGFTGGNDDHWTQHDAGFNELLKRLNGEQDPDAPEAKTPNDSNVSLQSLEERSKKSRARVHYKKFTRGKDLSQVNEKDLANIFGKRTLSDVHNPSKKEQNDSTSDNDTESVARPVLGLSTTVASVSVNDYFKAKMAQKGLSFAAPVKFDAETSENTVEEEPEIEHSEHSEAVSDKPAKKSKKRKIQQAYEAEELMPTKVAPEEQPTEKVKKKKKSKKTVAESESVAATSNGLIEEPEAVTVEGVEEPVKKKSKSKSVAAPEEEAEIATNGHAVDEPEESVPPKKKKKKSKKNKSSDDAEVNGEDRESDGKDNNGRVEEPTAMSPAEPMANAAEYCPDEEVVEDEEELTCRVKVAVLKHLDESRFAGSNFGNIIGYRLTEEVKLVKNNCRIPGLLDQPSKKAQKSGGQKSSRRAYGKVERGKK
uniref:G-patch domain-containing protein n=1 Tax=Anopheles farauti TaxID=69004 RepID=A0A182Q982_9DIPT